MFKPFKVFTLHYNQQATFIKETSHNQQMEDQQKHREVSELSGKRLNPVKWLIFLFEEKKLYFWKKLFFVQTFEKKKLNWICCFIGSEGWNVL